MPGNTVVINGDENLSWYVGDSKMNDVMKVLDVVGIRTENLKDENKKQLPLDLVLDQAPTQEELNEQSYEGQGISIPINQEGQTQEINVHGTKLDVDDQLAADVAAASAGINATI